MKADALPPFIAHDKREREWMVTWVTVELNQQRCEEPSVSGAPGSRWFAELAAWYGNMRPLRALASLRGLPEAWPFLQPVARGPGTQPRHKRQWAIDRAVEDVSRIRALWLKYYSRSNRPRDQISAEEIAALIWDVDPHDLANALK
jgi:hypothetical protein